MADEYKPGDVVNGHRLTEDKGWVPVDEASAAASSSGAGPTTAMPATPYASTAAAAPTTTETKPKVTKRRWFLPLVVGIVAFLIGLIAGSAGKSTPTTASGAAPASTVTATAPSSGGGSTATVTAAGPTVTVTATAAAPAAPAANADPAGPKDNNQYLVGKEIAAGNWRCTKGTNLYWQTSTQSGDIVDNGLQSGSGSVVANIKATAYTVDLKRCDVPWVKIG